jgi:anthranilate synthase/aminodeoxychorismate synthase-like glutamine amidotransferase
MKSIILIDHYDSFTLNIQQTLIPYNIDVKIFSYDQKNIIEHIKYIQPSAIILGPGPGHPKNMHPSKSILECFYQTIPFLGICLGHQLISLFFGGEIISSSYPAHGKKAKLEHNIKSLPQNIWVGRYHSLILTPDKIPMDLEMTGWIQERNQTIPMMIKHRDLPIIGMQFHPESVLTEKNKLFFDYFLSFL